ncbi:MAG: hypothetical protein OEY09_10390 [Gammaproteobacteria bacterium]|nr:hypothetical protein [Gammaproteobacteria bacterium]
MNAIDQAYRTLYSWSETDKAQTCNTLPPHIQRAVDLIERHNIVTGRGHQQALPFDQAELFEAEEMAQEAAAGFQARREAEERLADYIEDVSLLAGRSDLADIADRLRDCRKEGHFGLKPDGGLLVAWANKCGLVRLCPDESREETQRLTEFYLPELLSFANKKPTHRIFYSVLTTHNYRPDDLARGKKELSDKLKDLLHKRVEYCPVSFKDGPACGLRQVVKTKEKLFPMIKGALSVQEDPLSVHGDWNVHQNIFFMVEGAFSYKDLRHFWNAGLYIKELGKDSQSIQSALLEAIKYSAQIVPTKSEVKANEQHNERLNENYGNDRHDQYNSGIDHSNGNSVAPSMIEWPYQRFIEWWDAQQKFRRVRSYGLLYAAHGKRWDRMTPKERLITCTDAELSAKVRQDIIKSPWKEIYQDRPKKEREKIKVKLRHSMVHGEKLDPHSIRWLGSLNYDGRAYRVDLIPGDNFSARQGQKGQLFNDRGSTGPPFH